MCDQSHSSQSALPRAARPQSRFAANALGGRSKGRIEPGVGAEDFSQHLAMDAVMALRPFAGRKERHFVEAIARECDAHMSHALRLRPHASREPGLSPCGWKPKAG